MIRRLLHRLLPSGHAEGGTLPPYTPREDSQLAFLSPGREITDPDEAEVLGMAATARRMRRQEGRS